MRAGWGLRLTALLGLLYALWAIWGAGQDAVLWGLALLAAGIPVHLLMRRSVPAQQPAE